MTESTSNPSPDLDPQAELSMRALRTLFFETLKPWLFEFGNWIFGGLIAFNLVIAASLLTVGPIHPAILVSLAAFSCALPLSLTGLLMLKFTKDMEDMAFDDLMKQAFKDVDFPDAQAYFASAEDQAAANKKRGDLTLRYASIIALMSATLSLIGMVAALWYMAWWIGILFIVMSVLSPTLFMAVMGRSMPPQSEQEKELRRRHTTQLVGQQKTKPKKDS